MSHSGVALTFSGGKTTTQLPHDGNVATMHRWRIRIMQLPPCHFIYACSQVTVFTNYPPLRIVCATSNKYCLEIKLEKKGQRDGVPVFFSRDHYSKSFPRIANNLILSVTLLSANKIPFKLRQLFFFDFFPPPFPVFGLRAIVL